MDKVLRDSCDGCDAHFGVGCCRDNLELECAAGGGYEAWRPKKKPSPVHEIQYILTLTPEQHRIVERACEFYARVMMGQFGEISYETMLRRVSREDFSTSRDMMDDLLFHARKIAFPELQGRGHSLGIGHDAKADRAFNVYEVLRHARAWHEHPEGGVIVDFNEPMPLNGEPLPKCEVRRCENENH